MLKNRIKDFGFDGVFDGFGVKYLALLRFILNSMYPNQEKHILAVTMKNLMIITIVGTSFLVTGCATKKFDTLDKIDFAKVQALSCQDIEREFLVLEEHRSGVDNEATGGQVKQMLWGGIWSVMADEKREDIARDEIRRRERLLYEAKLDKRCS